DVSMMAGSFGAYGSRGGRTVRDREVGGSNPLARTTSCPTAGRTLAARRPAPAGGRAGDVRPTGKSVTAAAEIVVEGRVQGVGYRDYAQRQAGRLGLAGFVMN